MSIELCTATKQPVSSRAVWTFITLCQMCSHEEDTVTRQTDGTCSLVVWTDLDEWGGTHGHGCISCLLACFSMLYYTPSQLCPCFRQSLFLDESFLMSYVDVLSVLLLSSVRNSHLPCIVRKFSKKRPASFAGLGIISCRKSCWFEFFSISREPSALAFLRQCFCLGSWSQLEHSVCLLQRHCALRVLLNRKRLH